MSFHVGLFLKQSLTLLLHVCSDLCVCFCLLFVYHLSTHEGLLRQSTVMFIVWSHLGRCGLLFGFSARTVPSCGLEILFHLLRLIFKCRADGSRSSVGAAGEDVHTAAAALHLSMESCLKFR